MFLIHLHRKHSLLMREIRHVVCLSKNPFTEGNNVMQFDNSPRCRLPNASRLSSQHTININECRTLYLSALYI